MNPIDGVKQNWRVLLLVSFLLFAVIALFVPGGIVADDSVANESVDSGPTNLEFGLSLDGGTRIRAPVVGMTAEDIETGAVSDSGQVDGDRIGEIESTLYEELDLDTADARVTVHDDGSVTAEVFTDNVTQAEFATALQSANVDASEDDIRDGVTEQTRNEMIGTLQTKINEAGLSGGSVYEQTTRSNNYIVVEVPNMDSEELRSLLSERGVVEVVAYYPDENGTQTNETVLTQDQLANVDSPRQPQGPQGRSQGYMVPIQVSEEAAPEFQRQMEEYGFLDEGYTSQGACNLPEENGNIRFDHEGQQYCLLTVSDGEVVDAHSMGSLADGMIAGTWVNDPTFQMGAPSQQEAQSLSVNLRAGSLRAPLDLSPESAQVYSITPSHADQFKQYSLLIGLLSVVTVSGVVYARYTDTRIALPMIVTALSEVVILLGFAALIRMPLDLSHVAGFIAVVGTGVDDLVIIADEVLDEGDVSSERVFQSRFRKAFWVIGAAAATTIVALSPLAVLSLGDLKGFAIITILGVLIGVLITRPAYGDILRRLLTDR
ncbi:preprotein translocase subunit SecD [Natrinema sp. SYSU A 869]|uniref:preprotein translocase subunit SecD n=1 Tax=Natrinema sp. SYSU A 869 TaxID=2871694 RepID=UPI001CA43DA5|nr:preprotein translocase subunit SecD [Natrinema sp. SYSU A 869]